MTDAAPATVNATLRERVAEGGQLVGVGAVLVAVVMLSLGSTVVKATGEPGPVVAFWRLLFGAVIWHGVLAATGRRLEVRTAHRTLPGGLLFGLDLLFFFSAVRLTRVANAEFIGTLVPVIVIPVAAVALGERVRARTVALGAVALIGVAVVVFNAPSSGGESNLAGDLLAVGAVTTWASFFLVAKHARATVDTARFMAGMTTTAALVVLPVALATGDILAMSAKAWVLCGVLALVTGTAAHGLLVWAQGHVPVSTSSVLGLAQPGFAALWAFVFLGESVRPVQVAGMAVVLGALAVLTASSSRTPADGARSGGAARRGADAESGV